MLALLAATMLLTGCTTWRASPFTDAQPAPLPLAVDNAGKTIDLSYRFSGDDQRWADEGCRRLVVGVYERCGYLVNQVPWASQPGVAPRVRVEVVHVAERGWTYPSQITLAVLPGYARFATTVSVEASHGGAEARHAGEEVSKSFAWLPLFWLWFSARTVAELQSEGIEAIVRTAIVGQRERGILKSP